MSRQEKNVRVLIAEDDYLVCEMIKVALKEGGYAVVGEAMNGLEAVEKTSSLRPDVVLMDIKMPDMDGLEATRRIYEYCPTPVVVLTAYETADLVKEASAAGVGAYLVKPSNAREIERAITIAMARFDDLMELRRLNAELQTRNEELDAFAHTVAHDLRNPLSLIIGFAGVLEEHNATMPDEEREKHLSAIVRNGHKMCNIINELLVLAEVRKAETRPEPL